ncbi:MAG: glycosyltransferase family 61 protein [Hyphomicrobium sp.]
MPHLVSFKPAIARIQRLVGRPFPDIEARSYERWTIAPADRLYVKPAVFDPDHLDRIRRTDVPPIDAVVRRFQGDYEIDETETVGFLLRDVDLVDGVLYGARSIRHLQPNSGSRFAYRPGPACDKAALFESWIGNRWFGNWLADDCLTYELAQNFSTPTTTNLDPRGHVPAYEARLGMRPVRMASARFRELIVFRDESNNAHKQRRAVDQRRKLVGDGTVQRHPGVFLLRGQTGDRRILLNEAAIAEDFAQHRGFKVLDASTAPVDEIVRLCSGAQIVAGVEGSQLVHGQIAMADDAGLFVIQPPWRTTAALKIFTDRRGQRYGFVVGAGGETEFTVDWQDIAPTLDALFAKL